MQNTQNNSLINYLVSKGVPRIYIKDTDVNGYPVSVKKLLEDVSDKSFFFYGSVGTGKTQLAVDLMTTIAQQKRVKTVIQGHEVERYDNQLFKFYSMPKLLISVRNLFGKQESLADFLTDLNTYEYLVIDDFGVEKKSDWVGETLYVIINERYANMQKMIITSNKSMGEIAEELDDRIASRLTEMCEIVKFEGEDKRLK